MKIGFYGHSNCAYLSEESFLDIVAGKLNAQIVNTGVRQGSEERILYELKKTKKIDLAIIFHSYPNYLFLPGCDRDFDLKSILRRHAENVWESFEISQIKTGWDFHLKHHKKFIEKFKDLENFVSILSSYKDYLYDPDLQLNRFYGSVIQINQYLKTKDITAIHIVEENYFPQWIEMHGLVDSSVLKIIDETRLTKDDQWSANGITIQGNNLVAERLVELYAASSRQEYTNNPIRDGGSNPPAAPLRIE